MVAATVEAAAMKPSHLPTRVFSVIYETEAAEVARYLIKANSKASAEDEADSLFYRAHREFSLLNRPLACRTVPDDA